MNNNSQPHPETEKFDHLVAELCDKIQDGGSIDLEWLTAQHPEHADELKKVLPALMAMNAWDPDLSNEHDVPTEKIIRSLGDFRIIRQIGRGGMGVVYEAEQLSVDRRVALKVLPLASLIDDRALVRFRNEVRAAATLEHPNIVSVYSVGEERGVHYFAMQLIRGQSMATVIQVLRELSNSERNLDGSSISKAVTQEDPDQIDSLSGRNADKETRAQADSQTHRFEQTFFLNAVRMIIQAANALDHAHQSGVIHRDIKPANLMINGNGQLFITDFGLARMESDTGVTMTGDLLGTLRYMSPEQILANRMVVDQRTDIYSLGATLFELLALRPVFEGNERPELIRQISLEEPPLLRKLNPAIPFDLETVVDKALRKNPIDRYNTAGEFADDLQRFLDNKTVLAKRPSTLQRLDKWTRRNPAISWASVAVLMISVLALAISNAMISHERKAKDEALVQAQENFERAREAVDQFLTQVSEDELLNEASLQPLRKDLLELALQYYQQFIEEQGEDPVLRAELAAAHFRVGNIHELIGSNKNALQSHSVAMEIRKQLVADFPAEPTHRHDLAESQCKVGYTQHKTGQNDAAKKLLESAVQTATALVEKHPDVPGYLDTLAKTQQRLGQFQRILENRTAARNSLEAALRNRKLLSEISPDDSEYQRKLANAYGALAFYYWDRSWQTGSSEKALELYGESVRICEKLSKHHPENIRYKHTLASVSNNLGLVYLSLGDKENAVEQYRNCIEIQSDLVAKNPLVSKYRHSLAGAYCNMGTLVAPEEAMDAFQKAIQIESKLTEDYPEEYQYREFLRNAYSRMASLQRIHFKKFEDALISIQNCLSITQQLVEQIPNSFQYMKMLAQCYADQGVLLEKMGRPEDAARSNEKAVELRKKLAKQYPDDPYYRWILGGTIHNLSGNYAQIGKKQLAIEQILGAIDIQSEVVKKNPNVREIERFLGQHYGLAADIQLAIGNLDEARQAIDEALRIRKRLANANLNARQDQALLADAYFGLGKVLFADDSPGQASENFANAKSIWEQLCKKDPSNDETAERLARLLSDCPIVELRDSTRAVELASSATEIAPEAWQPWLTLGIALYRDGRFSDSISALEKHSSIRETPEVQYLLAMAHHRNANRTQAQSCLAKAEKLMTALDHQSHELKRLKTEANQLIGSQK